MKSQKTIALIIMLCLAALIAAGCGGAEQRKSKYLAKGKAYMEQQNYDKARIEFQNVLQIDPKYAEAYYQLGLIEEKNKNWDKAFGSYSKTVDLNPDHLDARAKLGFIYLLSGSESKASEMMEAILAKQPDSVNGRVLKAAIMARKKDVSGAIREASDIITKDPTQIDAIALLVSLYEAQKEPDKAIKVLIDSIAKNPKNIPLRISLVNLLIGKNDTDRAEQVFHEIISLQPENLESRVALASFYSSRQQLDKAEKTLRDAIEASPHDANRYLVLADFLISRRGVAQAETELLAAIKANPKIYELRFGLAKLYVQTNANDKAEQTYRAIIDETGVEVDGLTARNRLAELLFRQGKREEAENLAVKVLKENPRDNDALVMKGSVAMAKGNADDAIVAFRSVLKDQPNSVNGLIMLADAHMLKNETDLARTTLQKAVELNPKSVQARLALASYYARSKDYDGALKQVDEALKISPNDLNALLARAGLMAGKGDAKGAESALEKVKAEHPDNPVGYYQLGQFFLSQKKYDNAIREFEAALKKTKDTFQILTAIVNTNVSRGKPDKAVARLNEIIKGSPDHIFAHELLGEVYGLQKKYEAAEKSFRKAIEVNPKWNVPYRNLANLYLVRGNFPAASEVDQEGLRALPEDPQLLFHLAATYERAHDYEHAVAAYERILGKDPSSDLAANNLAVLLAEQKTDSQSLKRAKELAVRFESSSQYVFRDTLGWVYYKAGETDKAVTVLSGVVNQMPSVPIFRYHLGMAYYKQGKMPEAKTHLSKAVQTEIDFPGIDEARATLKQIP
ncbi:MAG: tetratricopeptide repeat protein [Proteobacteria bacterium]|nr:tetratricopeptide repeat protein [Pseudomonadota bacterium]